MHCSLPCLHWEHAASNKKKQQGRRSIRRPCIFFLPCTVYGYITTGLTTSGLLWLTVAPTPLMT